MSSLSGVTATRRSSSAARSEPSHGALPGFLSHIGDPVVGVAAAVLALVDMQALLAAPALRGRPRDALDLVGRAIREIDVEQDVMRACLR